MSACLCGFMSEHMCVCVCVCVCLQVCVGVRKISHLREEDEGWASRVFVFVSPGFNDFSCPGSALCLSVGGGGC